MNTNRLIICHYHPMRLTCAFIARASPLSAHKLLGLFTKSARHTSSASFKWADADPAAAPAPPALSLLPALLVVASEAAAASAASQRSAASACRLGTIHPQGSSYGRASSRSTFQRRREERRQQLQFCQNNYSFGTQKPRTQEWVRFDVYWPTSRPQNERQDK